MLAGSILSKDELKKMYWRIFISQNINPSLEVILLCKFFIPQSIVVFVSLFFTWHVNVHVLHNVDHTSSLNAFKKLFICHFVLFIDCFQSESNYSLEIGDQTKC